MIVSAHGGTIKASHNTNKGTVFTIKLPRWDGIMDFLFIFIDRVKTS